MPHRIDAERFCTQSTILRQAVMHAPCSAESASVHLPHTHQLQTVTHHAPSRCRHQREVGTGYFDVVSTVVSQGQSSTVALHGSTETAQFHD